MLFRRIFPYAAAMIAIAALVWAVSFGTLPPADFTFNNEEEVKTVDPGKAAGTPEHRILDALYEGLLRLLPADVAPDQQGLVPLTVQPGVAELPEISSDARVYTFHLRDNARWSDGDRVTAHDFVWSWRRTLHPDNASEYAYQLYYVAGARQYNQLEVRAGDRVEVELLDRRDSLQPFPRGTMVYGVLREIVKPPFPDLDSNASAEQKSRMEANWKRRWVYVIEEKGRGEDGRVAVNWNPPGRLAAFSEEFSMETERSWLAGSWQGSVVACQHVLVDFASHVGARAVDDSTLVVTLTDPTPFFSELTTFYPLFPVKRNCVERYGSPAWTKPGNIVTNGPFILQSRRIRDRIRLVKNPFYWNAANVHLQVVDALPLKSRLTALNMFLNGELDWNHAPPGNIVPDLRKRSDYLSGPALITYFYRLNLHRKPLDDVRVRQALNLSLDKRQICEFVTQAGEIPARSLVPLGMPGYKPAFCEDYNPEKAKQLLVEAGFPGGRGFPKLEFLSNADEMHKAIAEVVQQQWRQTLGIDIELRGIAWSAYLDAMHKSDFEICRAGWVPDYTDPNTFLDLFVTDGAQNSTHWSHSEYDALIRTAAAEPDTRRRSRQLHDAEAILMNELPILPIFYYVTKNMVKPRVQNFHPNLQDVNPISVLRVDAGDAAQRR